MSALGLGRVKTHWVAVPEYDWEKHLDFL